MPQLMFVCYFQKKMSNELVINYFFLRCPVATTFYPSCMKSSVQSSTKLQFHVQFLAIENKKYLKTDIYLNHSSTSQFRPVLPLHKNYPIDLQSQSIGWFLYNGNTANFRHHLFQILILTWLKTFSTTFPSST